MKKIVICDDCQQEAENTKNMLQEFVKEVKRDQILVRPDIKIPISRHYQPIVKEEYMDWTRNNLF